MDIRETKLKGTCFAIFWAVLGGAFTSLCMIRGSYYELIFCLLVSMVLCGYYIPQVIPGVLEYWAKMGCFSKILCILAAITIAWHNITLCYQSQNIYYLLAKINMGKLYPVLFIVLAVLSVPMFLAFTLYGFSLMKDSIQKVFTDYRRYIFLAGILSVIVAAVYLFFTDVFFMGYNAVYSMDSSRYIETNVYINFTAGENDIRQPFFGIASSLIFALSNFICLFIPGIYPYLIGMADVFLIIIAVALLIDMMELKDKRITEIALAYFMVLYPVILFLFAIEQYAVVFFFTMVFLHQIYSGKREEFVYALNAGGLIISGAWLPIIGIVRKKGKYDLKKCITAVIALTGTAVVFGRFSLFTHSIASIKELLRFSGTEAGLSMTEHLKQYFNFVANCFIKTGTAVVEVEGSARYILNGAGYYWIAGIFIFALCIAGFAVNREKFVCRAALYWLLIGFFVMAVIGWGTVENNLVLYSLYFGWPFAVLFFGLINKWLQNRKIRICFVICILCMGLYNIWGLADILRFGALYY